MFLHYLKNIILEHPLVHVGTLSTNAGVSQNQTLRSSQQSSVGLRGEFSLFFAHCILIIYC